MKEDSIVQLQVEAYNARDLDKFCSFYSEDIKIHEFQSNELFLEGIKELRKRYSSLFEMSPSLHCEIRTRIIHDNIVIDQEYDTGFRGDNTNQAVVMYEILNEKITRVWFLK